jgi:hypothetical protein
MTIVKGIVCGVGINDADYVVKPIINGVCVICPIYEMWTGILKRCYNPKAQKRRPTYVGCTVSKEWLRFSNFKKWCDGRYSKGLQIDKDLLKPNNKIYSAETCIFVTLQINTMLQSRQKKVSKYPTGVNRSGIKFTATFKEHGVRKHLGSYDSPEEASKAYIEAKLAYIHEVAEQQDEPLRSALKAFKVVA